LAGGGAADIRLNPIGWCGACRHSFPSYWLQYCRCSFKSYWLVWLDTADNRLNPIGWCGACRHSSQSYWLQYCRRSCNSFGWRGFCRFSYDYDSYSSRIYWLVVILQLFFLISTSWRGYSCRYYSLARYYLSKTPLAGVDPAGIIDPVG
jgi:hypothetical protein